MSNQGLVLVTGAAGFIGSRVAEVLHSAEIGLVRAAVRRWGSAARIGRLPIEIQQCDVTDAAQVETIMKDVSAVVHCAVGTTQTNVAGTKNLLETALKNRVRRFVHISTIDVYGEVSDEISEEAPFQYTGKQYGDTKIEAEKLCHEFYKKGLPIVILRPTIVYGPFSNLWTIEFAERLTSGDWFLAEEYCHGRCNLLYVDDLVNAILLGLSKEEAVGEVFNINGADRVTWNDYFHELNAAMGLPQLQPHSATRSRVSASLMMPVRRFAKLLLRHYEKPIMAIYQRSTLAKRLMRGTERLIRKTPTTAEFELYSRNAFYSTAKAARLLGYQPKFDMKEGTSLSVAWLRHHKYLDAR